MKILDQKLNSRVAVVIETSSRSRRREDVLRECIDNGVIQNALNEIFSFALQLNQTSLNIFINESFCAELGRLTSKNCTTFVETEVKEKACKFFCGTQASKAYYKAVNRINCKEYAQNGPTIAFVMSVDDISIFNKRDIELTAEALEKSTNSDVFYVFMGVGTGSFRNLRKIASKFQNVGFMKFKSFKKISTDKIAESTEQYIPWLKAKGFVK